MLANKHDQIAAGVFDLTQEAKNKVDTAVNETVDKMVPATSSAEMVQKHAVAPDKQQIEENDEEEEEDEESDEDQF